MTTLTHAISLSCPRCGEAATGFRGCPTCAASNTYVNLSPPLVDLKHRDLARYPGGPWGWPDTLPLLPATAPVTLGEGNTPVFPLDPADPNGIWVKSEAGNPTWSHKDRGMSVAVAKAVEVGADTVVAPSSGNAGLATAAYAARAGLRAVILTTSTMPATHRAMLEAVGAIIVAFEHRESRHLIVDQAVDELGWFPTTFVDPRVGGNPYGNMGYKSIAYELARDLGSVGAVVVPTARADLLSGICRGFEELVAADLTDRMPKMVAAEVEQGAAFAAALATPDRAAREQVKVERRPSPAFSIGSEYAIWQGLHALERSGGSAVSLLESDYMDEQRRLGVDQGLAVEVAAAVAVAGARKIAPDVDGITVAMSTAAGTKDPVLLSRDGAPAQTIPGDLEAVVEYVDRETAKRRSTPLTATR